jgi:hypothetical protein
VANEVIMRDYDKAIFSTRHEIPRQRIKCMWR